MVVLLLDGSIGIGWGRPVAGAGLLIAPPWDGKMIVSLARTASVRNESSYA